MSTTEGVNRNRSSTNTTSSVIVDSQVELLQDWLINNGICEAERIIQSLNGKSIVTVEDLKSATVKDEHFLTNLKITNAYVLQIKKALKAGSHVVHRDLAEEVAKVFSTTELCKELNVIEQDQLEEESNGQKSNVIGSGSFGIVCRGLYQGEPVAIKRLISTENEEAKRSLCLEAIYLHLSINKRVVKIIGVDHCSKPTMIVMELMFCSLKTLLYDAGDQFIELRSQVGVYEKLRMMRDCCECLVWLINNNMLHRDIKPGNILVNSDLSIRLSDFGLARFETSVGNDPKGSLFYMAPELIRYNDNYKELFGEASEMYSFTVTLNEVLSEKAPYQTDTKIIKEMHNNNFNYRPSIYECPYNDNISEEIKSLINIGWHIEPKLRPTFHEVWILLGEIMEKIETKSWRNDRLLTSESIRLKGPISSENTEVDTPKESASPTLSAEKIEFNKINIIMFKTMLLNKFTQANPKQDESFSNNDCITFFEKLCAISCLEDLNTAFVDYKEEFYKDCRLKLLQYKSSLVSKLQFTSFHDEINEGSYAINEQEMTVREYLKSNFILDLHKFNCLMEMNRMPSISDRFNQITTEFSEEINKFYMKLANFESQYANQKSIPSQFFAEIQQYLKNIAKFKMKWVNGCAADYESNNARVDAITVMQQDFKVLKKPIQDRIDQQIKKIQFIEKISRVFPDYIGRGDEVTIKSNVECYILCFTYENILKFPAVWALNSDLLQQIRKKNNVKSIAAKYILLDLDTKAKTYQLEGHNPPSKIAIHRRPTNGLWQHDIAVEYSDYNNGISYCKNFGTFSAITIKDRHKIKTYRLAMPCPLSCNEGSVHEWVCSTCANQVEYAESIRSYLCLCGSFQISSKTLNAYRFRCGCKEHGTTFTSFPKYHALIDEILPNVKTNALTILLFGETGVGKTTFVNSLANYLAGNSLPSMTKTKHDVICLTNVKYEYSKKKADCTAERSGLFNNEEDTGSEVESHTVNCTTYIMYWHHIIIRVIDTPGVHDTRGEKFEIMNTMNIMAYLTKYKNVNAFMFLIKAGEDRITPNFQHCFKQLVTKLDKVALQNIVFVYTKCNLQDSKPEGNSSKALATMMNKQEIKLSLNGENTYAMDNQAFKWLVQIKDGMDVKNSDAQRMTNNWNLSSDACWRMLNYIHKIKEPYNIEFTISIFNFRRLFEVLAIPLGVTLETIKKNIIELQHLKNRFYSSNESKDFVEVVLTTFEVIRRNDWKTVCTHEECCRLHYNDAGDQIPLYRKVCEECSSTTHVEGHKSSVYVADIFKNESCLCNVCGHGPDYHDIIQVEYLKRETKTWIFCYEVEQKLRALNNELNKILMVGAELSVYLTQNSVGSYFTDSLEAKIDSHIRVLSPNSEIYNELLQCKASYEKAKQDLAVGVEGLQLDQLNDKIDTLYDLPLNGPLIRKSVAMQCEANAIPLGLKDSLIHTPKKPMSFRRQFMPPTPSHLQSMRNPPEGSPTKPKSGGLFGFWR